MDRFFKMVSNGFNYIFDLAYSNLTVIQAIVQYYFQKLLGQYLMTKLEFSLWSQKNITMSNTSINCDSVNHNYLRSSPFLLHSGIIGSLNMEIPFTEILSKPITLSIANVELDLYYNQAFSYASFAQQQ
jgi:hypothetical protein